MKIEVLKCKGTLQGLGEEATIMEAYQLPLMG